MFIFGAEIEAKLYSSSYHGKIVMTVLWQLARRRND